MTSYIKTTMVIGLVIMMIFISVYTEILSLLIIVFAIATIIISTFSMVYCLYVLKSIRYERNLEDHE